MKIALKFFEVNARFFFDIKAFNVDNKIIVF